MTPKDNFSANPKYDLIKQDSRQLTSMMSSAVKEERPQSVNRHVRTAAASFDNDVTDIVSPKLRSKNSVAKSKGSSIIIDSDIWNS